jgi:pimeloyl-ACP methyl ester carboxylesterase
MISHPTHENVPLILLPGMGADRRFFRDQLAALDRLTVPDWIAPEPRDTIPSYAERMARIVDPGGPCFVGGGSFGGMVALEMSRHLDAKACFLIGSIRSPQELPRRIRMLSPLTRIVPGRCYGLPGRLARLLLAVAGRRMPPTTSSLLRQLADTDGHFMRWASLAVLRWKPAPEPPSVPVLQIHGDRDQVLPHRLTRPDVLLHGAGHVLTMTHPDAVNEFLRSGMRRMC